MEAADIVARLARDTHGVFAAGETGLTKQQVRTCFARGWIERVLPGVARVAGAPITDRQAIAAAAIWGGERSLVAARSAATLWGIADITAPRPELWISSDRRHPGVQVLRGGPDRNRTRRRRDALWVCSPEWTLRDLLRTESDEAIECAFEQFRRDRHMTVASLRRSLEVDGVGTERRVGLLRSLMQELDGTRPCESPLEVRVVRLLRAAGIESPERQVVVGDHRFDFAWKQRLVALECFGQRWHFDPAVWQRDLARLNALGAATGFTILFATWRDTSDPAPLLAQIAGAFEARAA